MTKGQVQTAMKPNPCSSDDRGPPHPGPLPKGEEPFLTTLANSLDCELAYDCQLFSLSFYCWLDGGREWLRSCSNLPVCALGLLLCVSSYIVSTCHLARGGR